MTDFETQRRLSRLQTEAVHLGHKYGTINYDRQDGTWLHIARFPLGPGWNKTFVELLLDVPHGTPAIPRFHLPGDGFRAGDAATAGPIVRRDCRAGWPRLVCRA